MMPPTRKTAPEGVAIIGLQTSKGFRLSSTPQSTHPSDDDPPQATPKRRKWYRVGEEEGRRLPRQHNNASSEGNDSRKHRHC